MAKRKKNYTSESYDLPDIDGINELHEKVKGTKAPTPDADKLNEIIGGDVRPVVVYPIPCPKASGDELEDDFAYSREILKLALAQAALSVNELATIGQTSNHSRPYETLVGLISAISGATSQLMGLHEKKKKIANIGVEESNQTPAVPAKTTNINNQTNILCNTPQSTSDMLKALKEEKRETLDLTTNEPVPVEVKELTEKELEDIPF